MLKVSICEIDSSINQNVLSLDKAIEKIENHIIQQIDPTFPVDAFEEWVDSDDDKPFRWNKKIYYWSN